MFAPRKAQPISGQGKHPLLKPINKWRFDRGSVRAGGVRSWQLPDAQGWCEIGAAGHHRRDEER
ncbi:MAG: hypothetical protein SWE60_21175 [Thermodesulfobacteriota bacterium]|nr:hypothetical protein [Thermodesulfobacteriota bacterium]